MASNWLTAATSVIPVVGSIVEGIQNSNAQADANRTNVELQKDQQAYNTAMWERQTAYNSPEQQMDRYVRAGLNPNLVYGSASGNLAGNFQPVAPAHVEAVKAPDYGRAARDSLGAYSEMRMLQPTIDNAIAHATNEKEDTLLKAVQAAATGAAQAKTESETRSINWDTQWKDDMRSYSIDFKNLEREKLRADTRVLLNENERAAALNSVSIKEAIQRIAKMRGETIGVDQDNKLRALDIEMRNHGISPHDNLGFRMIGSFIDAIGQKSGVKSLLRPFNPFNH